MRIVLFSLLFVLGLTSAVFAVDVAPRISDREIIEKLTASQQEIRGLNQRFDDMNKRFDDLHVSVNQRFNDMNKRFDDLHASVNQRFDTLQWMLGLFVTVALVMLGLIMKMLWEQQRRITTIETTLETQKDEIAFFKGLVEKFLPVPRGAS